MVFDPVLRKLTSEEITVHPLISAAVKRLKERKP